MHIAKIERLIGRLGAFALAVCLIGCIDENPQSRDDDPFGSRPTGSTPSQCQSLDGPADPCPADNISNRPCEPGEASCRPYRNQNSCDDPLFCREAIDCPNIALGCPSNYAPCEDIDGPHCEELEVGTAPCVQTLWCRQVSGCPDIPFECPAGMTFCTDNPGEELDCQDLIVR